MDGKKPNSVTAISQQLQPENNPKVNDESIILLQYDNAAICNSRFLELANWKKKTWEFYGTDGLVYADNRHDLRLKFLEGYDGYDEELMKLEEEMLLMMTLLHFYQQL